jgi:hypothetical protein
MYPASETMRKPINSESAFAVIDHCQILDNRPLKQTGKSTLSRPSPPPITGP